MFACMPQWGAANLTIDYWYMARQGYCKGVPTALSQLAFKTTVTACYQLLRQQPLSQSPPYPASRLPALNLGTTLNHLLTGSNQQQQGCCSLQQLA